jgi:hypothetical protein
VQSSTMTPPAEVSAVARGVRLESSFFACTIAADVSSLPRLTAVMPV